jgi:hypothetical protein
MHADPWFDPAAYPRVPIVHALSAESGLCVSRTRIDLATVPAGRSEIALLQVRLADGKHSGPPAPVPITPHASLTGTGADGPRSAATFVATAHSCRLSRNR